MENIDTKLSERQRFKTKETKKTRALKELREMALAFMLGSVLLGGTIRRASEMVFDVKYEQQYGTLKKLDEKEKKLRELYGNNFPSISEHYKKILEQKRSAPSESLKLLLGQKPKDIMSTPWGPGEMPETPKTEVGSINTSEGTIDKKFIQQIVHETYPRGWVNNQVSRIVQSSQEYKGGYKGVWSDQALATFSRPSTNNEKGEIVFWKISEQQPPWYVVLSIGHEICHSNDWESDNEMTAEQRINLLLRVSGRLSAKDRFRSSYVESIKNDDPQKQRYNKAVEYWAVTCGQYFENATKLNIKDFRLVDNHVRMTDPNFNWMESSLKRKDLLNNGLGERNPLEPRFITEAKAKQGKAIADQNYDSSNQEQTGQ